MTEDDLRDLFSGLGPVSIRRMFGGKGIYYNGVIIAVFLRGELRLKGDEITAPEMEAAGGRRWTYVGTRHGKEVLMPYWTAPDSALDDPDEMAVWARKAYEAGLRSEK
jgi:DNA transformation protein and related proteins